MRNYLEGTETQKQRAYSPAVRVSHDLGSSSRFKVVQ
jgi:hypothetical protein